MALVDWFYTVEGQVRGPVSATQLRALVRAGRVVSGTLVWHAGRDDWVPAGSEPWWPEVRKPLAAERYVMPGGRSGLAIAAGYLGLFSIVLIPAPVAVVVGVLALRDLQRRPHLSGRGRAVFGIAMGVLGTIGLVWILTRG